MKFFMVFMALEALSFVLDASIAKKIGLSRRNMFFLGQSIILLVMAFMPYLGVEFVNPKNGKVLVEDDIVFPFVIFSLAFFCIFLSSTLKPRKE